jgi:hypothetical protein
MPDLFWNKYFELRRNGFSAVTAFTMAENLTKGGN